jgi:uncharacterized protein with von Willebrand factor type A (vWA) domain
VTTSLGHAPDELLLGFAHALRSAGVAVTEDRAQAYLRAVSALGLADRQGTYWAGRATLCSRPDDLARYDQVFADWFLGDDRPRGRHEPQEQPRSQAPVEEQPLAALDRPDEDEVAAMASAQEVLRHRDIAELEAHEKARLAALFAELRPRAPRRAAIRRARWHRGDVDAPRTLRRTLARMGEPAEIAWRRRGSRPRRVVLLVDVSGSMSLYADALLRLAHAFVQAGRFPRRGGGPVGRAPESTEVFTIGTRITHVTRAMRVRDPERALVAAGETVPDWSGGTRLGETLKTFLDRWGQRGLARGAVVVLLSDGWERGEADLLGEQMRRLHRLAHRVVWVNPHRGKPGYAPVQQGIVAALPYVDDFVAGHSMATFAELIEVVADA